MTTVVDQKIYEETTGKSIPVNGVKYHYECNPSFIERLLFLFGRKKVFVDNQMQYAGGTMKITNRISFLNL